MSLDGCVALPRSATGFSAVCYCGISWSYSLTIFNMFVYFSQYTKKISTQLLIQEVDSHTEVMHFQPRIILEGM